MDKEQRIEEIRTVAQEKMKENCRVHQPAFCNCTIDECKRTACWYWEADTLARQIYDALFPQGDDEGLLTETAAFMVWKKAWHKDKHFNYYKAAHAVAKAQRDLTRQEINIPKDMMAWILKRLNGKDASEFMLAVSVGKPLKEELNGRH